MRKPVIALAITVAILGGFLSIAAINADPSSAQKLTGKYALVYAADAHYGAAQDVRNEQLAERAFIVFSPVAARGGEGDCWLPLKSVARLRRAATWSQSMEMASSLSSARQANRS